LGVPSPAQADDPVPTVFAPGSFNSEIGCAGDWEPGCANAQLAYDADSGLYMGQFAIPAGTYDFKIAENGSWSTSWGLDGGSDNMTLTATSDPTYIIFDPISHLTAAAPGSALVTLPGSFQDQVGCAGPWMPQCLASVMYPLSDGTYQYSTSRLTAGSYEVKVAVGLSWDVNYGVGGGPGAPNLEFATSEHEVVDFSWDSETHVLDIDVSTPPLPGFGQALAQWIDRSTIAVPPELGGEGATWTLVGHPEIELVPSGPVTAEQAEAHKVVSGYTALHVFEAWTGPEPRPELVEPPVEVLDQSLRGSLEVAASDSEGNPTAQTRIQIAGVVDDLYADAATANLGPSWNLGIPTLSLWAPTATGVALELWLDPEGQPLVVPGTRDTDGVWSVVGEAGWRDAQYLWAVDVFVPAVNAVVTNRVTDPYSIALTVNSGRSVLVDLDDPALSPSLWTDTPIPAALRTQSAQTIYELHVRDFSIADPTVPAELRGTYEAFTQSDSLGMRHLKELADAGLTTVHLLPTFDIATIPELRSDQGVAEIPAAGPASDQQQAAVAEVSGSDGFNWGYDPWHYMAPEGSYASAPNQSGGARTAAFRSMVGALHDIGLRVVLDEVYNHTSNSGQSERSVLDKVVPGYYHRLTATGQITTSSCCQDTATENTMAAKLMVDAVVLWAKYYHIDGFRFDLMGFHSIDNMMAVRSALDELTVERDGVDGKSIYLYGEAWNFGELIDDARFPTARQANIAGTGIGTFNDRLRDGVRGGGPFDEDQRTVQGFGTGEATDPNGYNDPALDQEADLLYRTNLVRLGLIGNLADFVLPSPAGDGTTVVAKDMDYGGQNAGYAAEPQESVNYVDAHDNETLFDNGIWKLPVATSMADRVRMNTLSLATTALGQSPSFWHAGTEILRSKSLDRNSYDSGDHFNAIDWSLATNVMGTGLPMAGDNASKWADMAPLLENPALQPTSADMAEAYAQALDLLRLRHSTPLLSLGSGELIQQRVTFPNAGPDPTLGLLVMAIGDPPTRTRQADIDPALDGVLVVFNASAQSITEAIEGQAGTAYELSPIQVAGSDEVVKTTSWVQSTGTITIPARTVAVLVAPTADEPSPTGEPTPTGEPSPTGEPTTPGAGATTPPLVSAGSSLPAGLVLVALAMMTLGGGLLQTARRRLM
jgi:pullulanase-type alpha-1,6-glucosidase